MMQEPVRCKTCTRETANKGGYCRFCLDEQERIARILKDRARAEGKHIKEKASSTV